MASTHTDERFDEISFETNLCVYDHLRLIDIFADQYGYDFVQAAIADFDLGTTQPSIMAHLEQTKLAPKMRFQLSASEFRAEVAWICHALTDSIQRHVRHLALLELYDEDHRHRLSFVLRPILDCFEPSSEVANFLDVPASSLSRWIAGKARPQKIVRDAIRDRLIVLLRNTVSTLYELDGLLSHLLASVQLDRTGLEAECEALLDRQIDSDSREAAKVLEFKS